jgi:hypothetical protein
MSIKTWMMASGLAVCVLAQPAVAGPIEDGQAARDSEDYATILKVWRLLAEQGDAYAQYYLGTKYGSGQGVPPDYGEAAKWYRLAANQGYADAQIMLGDIYKGGRGLPQDFSEATKWYRLAADQGNAYAQYLLGFMYKDGYGVPQNYVQAYHWVSLADASGYTAAEGLRDVLLKLMTPDQIAEAQRLAQEWTAARPKK